MLYSVAYNTMIEATYPGKERRFIVMTIRVPDITAI